MEDFFVKRWDSTVEKYTKRGYCSDSDSDEEDYEKVSEKIKIIGATNAYSGLLMAASEKDDAQFLEFIINEMVDEHFSLLKMHKYFRLNFQEGNLNVVNIC